MSLKAKLEAVIYAAEEPVTLAQLAALFAGEALEWKAQQDAAAAEAATAQASSALSSEAENQLPLGDAFDYLEIEPGAESPAAPAEAEAGAVAEPILSTTK